jgi:ribonuclease P/MRP protein subunit POP5
MATSLNPLPPSKRERNRYLVYTVTSDSSVKGDEIGKAIWASALQLLGELGIARSGLRVVDFDEKNQTGVIKVNHRSVEEARLVLALVKEVNKKPAILTVIGVSGILKKARGKWATGKK